MPGRRLVAITVTVAAAIGVGLVGLVLEIVVPVDVVLVIEARVVVLDPGSGAERQLVVIEIGDRFLRLGGRRRGAKSRDLDDLPAEEHMREPKAPADQAAIAKQPLHLFGQRVGRDVEVLRLDAEQQIAHAPPTKKA